MVAHSAIAEGIDEMVNNYSFISDRFVCVCVMCQRRKKRARKRVRE